MDLITSSKNPIVKLIRSLDHKKNRVASGLFVAEGAEVLGRARALGWIPKHFVWRVGAEMRELLAWAEGAGAQCHAASEGILATFSSQGNPPDCLALFEQRWLKLAPAPLKDALWIALQDIRDPGNLGTIIRTAEAVKASGVILAGNSCDPYVRDCVRATMGSIFALPLARLDMPAFITLLRDWPGETVGTHARAGLDYRRDYAAPVLLVMGSEGQGLTEGIANACRTLVRIPMAGATESLNVAIATALMLYEIRRTALG